MCKNIVIWLQVLCAFLITGFMTHNKYAAVNEGWFLMCALVVTGITTVVVLFKFEEE